MCNADEGTRTWAHSPSFNLSPGPNEGCCIISTISFYACGVCNLAPLLRVQSGGGVGGRGGRGAGR